MPSKTAKQARTMRAAAHNPAFAKKVGIPMSVAKDFAAADKGRKFGTGGDVNYTYGGKGQINKQRTRGGSIFGVEKNVPNVNLNKYIGKKEGGVMATKKMEHAEKGEMKKDLAQDKKMIKKAIAMHDKQEHKGGKGTNLSALKKGGMAKKMAGGGLAAGHKSADGIATKGKTKGREIKMCGGGYMKKGK